MSWVKTSWCELCRRLKEVKDTKGEIDEEAYVQIDYLCNNNPTDQEKFRKVFLKSIDTFRFRTRIISTYFVSFFFSRFRELNCVVNSLAEKFDVVVNNRRGRMKKKDNVPIVEAKHRFFLAPYKTYSDSITGIYSHKYHEQLPPDKRLIYIRVDKSICRSAISVLHEMGHYIGIRQRRRRMIEFFIPVVSYTVCFVLYDNICCQYSGVKPNSELTMNRIAHGDVPQSNVANVLAAGDYLYEIDAELTEYIKNYVLNQINSLQEVINKYDNANADPETQYLLREAKATVMGFFKSIRETILLGLQAYLSQMDTDNEKVTPFHDQLINAIIDIKGEISKALQDGDVPIWYKTREEQFEEAIADVFMMRISGISVREFLDNLVYQYQTTYRSKNVSLTNPLLLTRAVGISLAAKAKAKDFSHWYDRLLEVIPFSFSAKEAVSIRRKLYNCYYEAKAGQYSKSFALIFDYMKEIWKDNDYTTFCETNKKELTRVRRKLCARKRLLRVLYWFLPKHAMPDQEKDSIPQDE